MHPASAGFAFAAQFVMGRAARHHGDPRRFDRHADIVDGRTGSGKIVQARQGTFGVHHLGPRGNRGLLMALHGKAKGFQTALNKVAIRLRPAQGAPRFGHLSIRVAPRFAGTFVGLGLLGQLLLQGFMRGPCRIGTFAHLFQRLFQNFQPVQLLQAQGRSRWRILGHGSEPVPPPKITLCRDQPLPGQQLRLKPRARLRIHQPNLAHAAFQHLRDRDMLRQWRRPFGQRLRL